jgi:nucleoside-diphosphate-sugar epimerase
MKLFVTGSESFIGKELKKQCRSANIEFVGIDSANPTDSFGVQLDIRSPQVVETIPQNVDALIHLAAISRDEDCRQDPYLAFDVNVQGTLNLIAAARKRGVRQFIFASSEWVYGQVDNDAIQTEDQPIDVTKIRSEYALTKIVAEQCLGLAFHQGFCPVTVLRFAIVYGPRPSNWSAVESLFNAVRTQDVVTVGSLATARRFVHVADIAAGIISSLGRSGFEIINLSGDSLVTLRDVIKESSKLLGRRPEVRESNPTAMSIRNPDNQKARSMLGWVPTLSLRDGLAIFMESSNGTSN